MYSCVPAFVLACVLAFALALHPSVTLMAAATCPSNLTDSGCVACDVDPNLCSTCGPGYYLFNTIACVQCPFGSFSTVIGATNSSVCLPCPANMTTGYFGLNSYESVTHLSYNSTACDVYTCDEPDTLCPYGNSGPFSTGGSGWGPSDQTQTVSFPGGVDVVSQQTVFDHTLIAVGISVAVLIGIVFFCIQLRHGGKATLLNRFIFMFHLSVSAFKPGHTNLRSPKSWVLALLGAWTLVGIAVMVTYESWSLVNYPNVYMQPGTVFQSSGLQVGTGTTKFSGYLLLVGSTVYSNYFLIPNVTVSAQLVPSGPSVGKLPVQLDTRFSRVYNGETEGSICYVVFETTQDVLLPLSSNLEADLIVTVSTTDENVVFTPLMNYNIDITQYDQSIVSIGEGYMPGEDIYSDTANQVLTGVTTVYLTAVPAETLNTNGDVTGGGYTFSRVGSVPSFSEIPSTNITVVFHFTVPPYYLQVAPTDWFTFLSNIAAIATAIVSIVSLFVAFLIFVVDKRVHVLALTYEPDSGDETIMLTPQK